MSSGLRYMASRVAAFIVVRSRDELPFTVDTPSRLIEGSSRARRRAIASSCPAKEETEAGQYGTRAKQSGRRWAEG